MKRPELKKVPSSIPRVGLILTMSVGQWDSLLQEAYDTGALLVELDKNENVVACYQRGASH